jgi:phosphodiesterase/alkaline phosphatase D-like protein
MNKKIRNVIAFVLLSAASLTMLSASPNTQPTGNPQAEPEAAVPSIVSASSENENMRTRADIDVPSVRFMASWDNVAGATGYLLDVSTNDSFSDYVDGYHDLDVGNVTEQVVTDLTPGTTYYYRVRAYTAIESGNYSEAMTVTTVPGTGLTSDVTTTSPEGINLGAIDYALVNAVVTTNAATNITSSSATLNGTVNPNGVTTTVHFEYGTTINYGSTTASASYTGNTAQNVSANIIGLHPNTTYHFRLVGTNTNGTTYGNDRTFIFLSPPGPPVAVTGAATNVTSFSASLNGSVNPNGLFTSVLFQYGTTPQYGWWWNSSLYYTGTTYQSVSANISQLSPSTTYHYRFVTSNYAGTRYGSDRTFTTLTATGAPVVTTNPATYVATSSATLHGSLDPHGLTTTVYLQYGTTTNYGHTTPTQSQTGNAFRDINADINGLSRHTTYHFRIVATNTAGTRYGADRTFTTQ